MQIARQISRQIDRYVDKQIDMQIDRYVDRQIDMQIDIYVDRYICRQIDMQIDRYVDRQIVDMQIDRYLDRQINRQIDKLYMNVNIIKKQIFPKIKFDLKGFCAMERLRDLFTSRPSNLITILTYVLMENFRPFLNTGHIKLEG